MSRGRKMWWASSAACLALVANSMMANDHAVIGIGTGYRQDSANLSICGTLSDPLYFGLGKLQARNVHIWEIAAQGNYYFTQSLAAVGHISWGEVLGGKVKDSGIADLNGDPWNAVIGADYSSCCCPPCAPTAPCDCGCEGQEYRPLTPVTARLSGNVWDFQAGLTYQINVSDHFIITPCIGYEFNRQSYTYRQTQWGPINMAYQPFPCSVDKGDIDYKQVTEATLPDGVADVGVAGYQDDTPYFEYVLPYSATYYWSGEDTLPTTAPAANLSENTRCLSIGNCFDGSNYRARWSGGFLGFDLGFAWQEIEFFVGYKAYLQNYSGRFKVGGACACNNCPSFYETGKEFQNPPAGTWDEIIAYSQALPKKQLAVPSEMRFSSWSYGQALNAQMSWGCGPVMMSLYFDVGYRLAPGCSAVSPCSSCEFVANPDLRENETAVYPVWDNATKRNARWNYLRAGIAAMYAF